MNIYYIIYSIVLFYYNIIIKALLQWFFNNLKFDFLSFENINIRFRIAFIKNNEYFFIILLFIIIIFSPIIFSIWVLHHLYISGKHIIVDYIFNKEIKTFIELNWKVVNTIGVVIVLLNNTWII